MEDIKLDVIYKQEGNRTDGAIRYGQKADGSHYEIPVIIVKGNRPGPTLLVDGATHGDETEGSESIARVAKVLEDGNFAGAFVGVPILNMEAFMTIRRSTLTDEFNLNRVFPGNQETYISHRLASVYIQRVVSHVDACISFHGGGIVLHLEPLCGYFPTGGETEAKSKAMAEAFNVGYVWRADNMPFSGVSAPAYAEIGVPCIIPEVGSHCSRLHDRAKCVEICFNGIVNNMIHLGMLDQVAPERVEQMVIELHYLHSYNGGIQTPIAPINTIVEQGGTLCVMHDVYGNLVEELKAPYPGVVIGFWSVPAIHPGDWWSLFAKIV